MSTDLLQQNQFTLAFEKLPLTVLRVQKCPIPQTFMSHTEIGTPFSFLKEPDTKLQFSTFWVQFKLDVNFDSYLNVFNWIRALGNPDNFEEYADWYKGDRKNLFSDATLTLYTNSNIPNIRINFKDLFPTALSEITFDSSVQDANYLDVTATFEYHSFTVEKIG